MVNLEALLKCEGYEYSLAENGSLAVSLLFDDDRHQAVYIDLVSNPKLGVAVCHIYSFASRESVHGEKVLRACLTDAGKHTLGSWELRDGRPCFCVKTLVAFSSTELCYLLNYVGVVADEFERQHWGHDRC